MNKKLVTVTEIKNNCNLIVTEIPVTQKTLVTTAGVTGRLNTRAHLGPMCGVVEVLLGVRVGHTGGVTTHDVEVGSGRHASLAVPLDLQDSTPATRLHLAVQ